VLIAIDYLTRDFTKIDQKFDLIFDACRKKLFGKCKPLILKNMEPTFQQSSVKTPKIYFSSFCSLLEVKSFVPLPTIKKEDVVFLKELVESGKYKPIVDRSYTLDKIVDAYSMLKQDKSRECGNNPDLRIQCKGR
jgi:hypothetical protein